jgi:hypothetical protein
VVIVAVIGLDLLMGQVYHGVIERKRQEALSRSAHHSIGCESPIYHHDLIPNKSVDGVIWGDRAYSVRTNSLGFRDSVVRDVPLKSGRKRIVFIGDSYTFGIGVDYDQTFVGHLADELSKKGTEVLNAGVVSYSPSIYYRKIRYLIEKRGLRFDELVVFLDISDVQDEAEVYYIDDNRNVRTNPEAQSRHNAVAGRSNWWYPVFAWLRDNSVILHVTWTHARNYFDPLPIDYRRSKWTVDDKLFEEFGRRGLESMRSSMDRLLDTLRRHGIAMTIVVYPWPDQIWYRDRESIVVSYWKQWAEEHRVRFVNLFPVFLHYEDSGQCINKYFIPGDTHWNEAGHRIVAKEFMTAYAGTSETTAGELNGTLKPRRDSISQRKP